MTRWSIERVQDLYLRAFGRLGLCAEDVALAAGGLLHADLHGIDSHGIANLARLYAAKLRNCSIDPRGRPRVMVESDTLAVIDGARAIGFVSGAMAMDRALAMATSHGCGTVGVGNATHAGALGYFIRRALDRGFIGIAATNLGAQAIAAPPGGVPVVGTNVLALGVPALTLPPFLLDMSTAAVSTGKIRALARAGLPIPEGWLFGPGGEDLTDPGALDRGEALLAPLGGRASWYKGLGLALFCELMCGAFSGAATAPVAAAAHCARRDEEIGLWFIAIRPPQLPGLAPFAERVDSVLAAFLQVLEAGNAPVLYPGLPEAREAERRRTDGVPIDDETLTALEDLAEELGIAL